MELGSKLWKAGSILPRALWFSFGAEVATGSKNCKVEEMAHRQQLPMLASETAVAWPGLSSGLGLCKVENCLSPKMLKSGLLLAKVMVSRLLDTKAILSMHPEHYRKLHKQRIPVHRREGMILLSCLCPSLRGPHVQASLLSGRLDL